MRTHTRARPDNSNEAPQFFERHQPPEFPMDVAFLVPEADEC
jgi:hypothetical protein